MPDMSKPTRPRGFVKGEAWPLECPLVPLVATIVRAWKFVVARWCGSGWECWRSEVDYKSRAGRHLYISSRGVEHHDWFECDGA
jgi:hypothetical protein